MRRILIILVNSIKNRINYMVDFKNLKEIKEFYLTKLRIEILILFVD